jgi:hypothetical protein
MTSALAAAPIGKDVRPDHRHLAQLSSGEVWVLHLREFELGSKAGVLPPRETLSDADAEVAASVEILTQAGVKAHGMVKNTMYGHAAREIVADAIELGCGVIVMGSRAAATWPGWSSAAPRTRSST